MEIAAAVDEASQLNAANRALMTAQGDLAAARGTGDAARVTVAQRALDDANAAKQVAVDQASKMQMAISAEGGKVPAELESLVTRDVLRASEEAIKAANRISVAKAEDLLANAPSGRRFLADAIDKIGNTALTQPAIFSKAGTQMAEAIESSALSRIRNMPGLSSRLAELELAAAREADNLAVGADKIATGARFAKASENLATLGARQELVAKAIGLGLGRSAEMMMFGAQSLANETALGDPALVAESAYAHMGFDAALGGAGGLLEATLPSAARAAVRGAKSSGRQLRDWFVRWFPEKSAEVTGASTESTRAILEQRAALKGKTVEDLGRILEEATPKVPEPGAPAGPVLKPEVPLTPVNFESAQREFRVAMEGDLKALEKAAMEANANIRKVEANKLIGLAVDAKVSDLLANAAPVATAAEQKALEAQARDMVRGEYQGALNGLVAEVGSLVSEPIGQQSQAVAARLSNFYEDLVRFADSNPLPEEMHREVKLFKRQLWDAGGNYKIPKNEMTLLPQKTQATLNDLRSKFVGHLEDVALYGDAAVREQAYNRVYTKYINSIKNLKKAKLIQYDFERGAMRNLRVNPEGVKSFVRGFGDDSNALRREYVSDYLTSRADLIDQIQESSQYARMNFDRQAVAGYMGKTTLAYDKAIDTALSKVNNKALEESNKLIREANEPIKAEYNELIRRQNEQYEADVSMRRDQIKEQARLLKNGADASGFKVVANILGRGIPGAVSAIKVMSGYRSLLAEPAMTAKALASLEKAARAVEQHTNVVTSELTGAVSPATKSARSLIGTGMTGKGIAVWADKKKLASDYDNSVKQLQKLTIDADARQDQLEDLLGDLEDSAPNINASAQATNNAAIDYLASKMPRPPAGLSPMRLAEWEPMDEDKRKFLRVKEAVARPMDTLSLATTGALLPEQVEALNTVYPALMQDVRSKLIAKIKETGKVPVKQRAMVSMLLGTSVDGAPALGVTAQSVYGQQRQVDAQKQAQSQMPMTRAQKLNLAERAEYEGSARRNAQLK